MKLAGKVILAVCTLAVCTIAACSMGTDSNNTGSTLSTSPPIISPTRTMKTISVDELRKQMHSSEPTPSPTKTEAHQYSDPEKKEVIVYITKSGEKYHSEGCQYLRKSCIEITLEDAKARGYEPCSKCNPPE